MSHSDILRDMLLEIAEREEAIVEVLQTEDESWAVRFAEVDVELALDGVQGVLNLSAEIGPLPEERRLEICALLLTYSGLPRAPNVRRMALSEPGGTIIQDVDLGSETLTSEGLARALVSLDETVRAWREAFASGLAPTLAPNSEFPTIKI